MCKSKKERALKNRELLSASINVIVSGLSEQDAIVRLKKMKDEYSTAEKSSARV